MCADARAPGSYHVLMGDERARMVFSDRPYNVRVDGHVPAFLTGSMPSSRWLKCRSNNHFIVGTSGYTPANERHRRISQRW
jgi:hypothetical protein